MYLVIQKHALSGVPLQVNPFERLSEAINEASDWSNIYPGVWVVYREGSERPLITYENGKVKT